MPAPRGGPFRAQWLVVACAVVQLAALPAGDEVVLQVGAQSLSAKVLQQRLGALTGPGLAAFGTDNKTRLRGYLQEIAIPELLLDQAAAQSLADLAVLHGQRDLLLAAALEQEIGLSVQLSDQDVQQYFDAHRSDFERPAAILLWRILVDDPQRARNIAKQCQGTEGVTRWRELSREQSLDKATQLRDGTLGFVRADGTTDVPQLQVDRALYEAASKVADGEIVPEAVAEGKRFAVVWRRGSRPAQHVALTQLAPSIRAALVRDTTRVARDTLLQELRRKQLPQFHPEQIELIKFEQPSFAPRDAFPPPRPSASSPLQPPKATERGLR